MVLKKIVTLVLLVVMTTLEMNGKQILSSEKVWYCTQQNLTESSFSEISTSNLEHKLFRPFYGFDFLTLLE